MSNLMVDALTDSSADGAGRLLYSFPLEGFFTHKVFFVEAAEGFVPVNG